ncbi:MAG: branched-chain amino acid ABC transporter permease [Candidatus Rokubacteria bacterium]|nr:branched-chain amino acid ABC transporter permease [Candidatus Rokubacteria bacterium]MBI2014005.1 branched-chain amino acid ABC transporter permease [Candidatus Rokubacteria bacterium]MBI2155948.1 branched-chain amino acid ABC transporter permease [Candidatus Rokubacteria bacterium]
MMLAESSHRWPWLLLLAVAVVGPPLTGEPYVAHLMVLGSLSALLAVGLNVALGFAGLFSFAQGAFYGIGAYVSALLVLSSGAGFWTAFLAAGVAAGLAGLLLGLLTIRLGGHYLAIATFAFQEIVIVVIRNWDSVTKGPLGLSGVPGPAPLALPGLPPLEFQSELAYYYLALAVLVLAVAVSWRLRTSQIGLELLAVRDDEVAARAMGVRAVQLKIFAFSASAVLAGLAGSLFAHYVKNVSPESFAVATSFAVLVSVLVGGLGTIMGPVLGGIALTFLPEYLRVFQEHRFTIYGALLIVVVIALPGGVAGGLQTLARRWRARAQAARP